MAAIMLSWAVALAQPAIWPTAAAYLFIADILQRVGYYRYAHVDQIGRGNFEHLLGELLAILVDLLDRHRAHDRPLVALERYQCNVLDFGLRFPEELLASRQQHILILALDLNLRNPGHGNWYALARVHGRALDLQRHRVERDSGDRETNGSNEIDCHRRTQQFAKPLTRLPLHLLNRWPHEGASTRYQQWLHMAASYERWQNRTLESINGIASKHAMEQLGWTADFQK
uniref:Putative secreted protein n=1 Tax=Anopheles darlingi TaxID=43151 RepID=A0A2M4DLA0_ANODA